MTATGRLPKVLRAIRCERRCRCRPWFSRPTHTCSNLPIAKELLFRNAQVGGNNHGVYTSESAIRLIIIPDSNEERNRIIEESYASSPPDTGHRGVRAGVAPPALDDGQHLPRAPRRGELPVQEPALAKAGDGMLPSDFFHRNNLTRHPRFRDACAGMTIEFARRTPSAFAYPTPSPDSPALAGEGRAGVSTT